LECVDVIVKRGIRSDYIRQEDNLPFMKGKLLMNQQIKYNAIRKERFYVEFDSFERNRPENRLIKSSLQKVLKISRDYRNQRLARELLFMFDDVPFSTDYKQDFQKCSKDRGMYYYRDSLDWCQLILEDKSPVSNKGEKIFRSFLFYMPKLFEKYVEVKLRQKLRTGYMLNPQAKEKTRYICTHINNEGMFKLKPDYLLIEKENSKPLYVLDAKWKLISNDKSDKNYGNYGIKQDDFYQMFAYGHKYLKGQGQMALIYPKTDEFNKRLEPFYFDESDEKKLTLWLCRLI
jgi:5-methylcytosine-specific restriction enzyme subunit McrC